jgi:hypothetical protein
MGFAGAVDEQYGAATPTVPGIRGPSPRVTQTTGGRTSGRGGQGARADEAAYDITPNVVPEFIAALVALGNAEYWKDFWGRARGTRRPPGFSTESEKQYEVSNTTYDTALRNARAKEAAYLKGLSKDGAFGRALGAFRTAYTRKGWLDQAFRNVESTGRKASPSVVDAIKRDVFKAYSEEVLPYDDAVLMAKRYVYQSVESDWDKNKMETMLASPGPSSNARYETKYGVLKSGTTAYVSLKSYSSGPEWFYPIPVSAQDEANRMSRSQILRESGTVRRYVINDRWKMLFGKIFGSSLYEEIRARRTTLDAERTAVEAKLESLKVDLGQARDRAVGNAATALAAERTVASAKTASTTAAQQAQVAATAAASKRTEAETKALGMDVAGTEAAATAATQAATQADTYAKQAEAAVATAASSFRVLGEAAKTDKTAVDRAASSARTAARNAGIDAQSAVARIEAVKAAKKAADDKAALDAVTRTVESAQQAVDAAQRNLDAVKARLALGQATQMDVDAAQRALAEATGRLVAAQAETARLAEAAKQSAQAASDLDKRADDLGTKVPEGAVQPRGRGPLRKVETDKSAQAGGEGFFSKYSTEVILGGAVLAIGGYFAWQKYGKK